MLFRLTDIHQRVEHNLTDMAIDTTDLSNRGAVSDINPYLIEVAYIVLQEVVEENMLKEDPLFVNTMAESLRAMKDSYVRFRDTAMKRNQDIS